MALGLLKPMKCNSQSYNFNTGLFQICLFGLFEETSMITKNLLEYYGLQLCLRIHEQFVPK